MPCQRLIINLDHRASSPVSINSGSSHEHLRIQPRDLRAVVPEAHARAYASDTISATSPGMNRTRRGFTRRKRCRGQPTYIVRHSLSFSMSHERQAYALGLSSRSPRPWLSKSSPEEAMWSWAGLSRGGEEFREEDARLTDILTATSASCKRARRSSSGKS